MMEWNKETEDCPKMVEVYVEQAWHTAFCFGLAVEEQGKNHPPLLLMAVIAGSDSALQSIKAAIDIGTYGMNFGHGVKETFSYRFEREFSFFSEKGKYEKFPITVNNNRKALIIVHEKLMNNEEYVLSFDGNAKEEIRTFLGGGKYGLHLLPEWINVIYEELVQRGHVEEVPCYTDPTVFSDGFSVLRVNLEESEADTLISELLRRGMIRFPSEGTGQALEEVYDLPTYMQTYVNDLVEKMAGTVQPLHNPLKNESFNGFSDYKRQLFPVQAHVATAAAKKLQKQRAVIINGEMSTGKTTMMVAATDAFYRMKGKTGYLACVMVPPSLTKKWPEEIREIIPHADVHVIERTEELIRFHQKWTQAGRPKPTKPTFFVISFTTMRGDAVIRPAVEFSYKKTEHQSLEQLQPYRFGFYCSTCGQPHQVVENKRTEITEAGEEKVVLVTRSMNEDEFGDTRRLHNGNKPANAFCSHCGDSLWTRDVPTRYRSFREWAKYERSLRTAIRGNNQRLVQHLQSAQPDIPKRSGRPRRIATIEYIRRKMKNFFDMAIVDEIHELKGGMTAQGNALGSLASAAKKVIAGTGTLFGGRADDVYYLLWRLFPYVMVENGYQYSDVRLWNEHFGNIEKTYVEREEKREYSNKSSRGGKEAKEKVLPGISPFVFGKFLIQNSILVRLVDVWPDPVELVDVPTILVDMDNDLRVLYREMVSKFEQEIHSRDDGFKLYLPLTDTGISLPDNPFTYPDVTFTTNGVEEVIYSPRHLSGDRILPKEAKLQEIIQGEMSEGRASIVYVRDTGSSREGRDVRPRLKKVLEDIGAKVAILDASTTQPNRRSEWLKQKVEKEGYNVIIVSQELVKVGLDLLCTPTLIFYQFSWSLFTINQAARRAWRIGQHRECRLFYLAYRETYQAHMAQLIAMKNKAAAAMSGEVSSEGLSAMLGDEGDLQSMLIKAIKERTVVGSTEEWTAAMSDRARAILAGIGKTKVPTVLEQFKQWVEKTIETAATKNVLLRKASTIVNHIESGKFSGFTVQEGVLHIDLVEAFGFDLIDDGAVLAYLVEPEVKAQREEIYAAKIVVAKRDEQAKKNAPADGQLAFDLFAI
jgi:hypothetical protein